MLCLSSRQRQTKLTAFAPKTTGVLYSKNRPVEIIKQLFDVAFLTDNITDLKTVVIKYLQKDTKGNEA